MPLISTRGCANAGAAATSTIKATCHTTFRNMLDSQKGPDGLTHPPVDWPGVRQQFERRFRGRLKSIGPWSRGRVGYDSTDATYCPPDRYDGRPRVHGGYLQAQSQQKPAPAGATVYLTPTCGCCSKWADHLKTAGFTVTREITSQLDAVPARRRVPESAALLPHRRHRELSCRRTRPGGSRPKAVEGASEDRRHRGAWHARRIARDGK